MVATKRWRGGVPHVVRHAAALEARISLASVRLKRQNVKFEILGSTAAQPYRWRIVASNGRVLAMFEKHAS
jgi:hypothetical protein